jgi:hypothetical protein
VLHALLISFFMAWPIYLYLAKSTSYEAPHYAFFSNMPSRYPSSAQIFFSADLQGIISQRTLQIPIFLRDVYHYILLST